MSLLCRISVTQWIHLEIASEVYVWSHCGCESWVVRPGLCSPWAGLVGLVLPVPMGCCSAPGWLWEPPRIWCLRSGTCYPQALGFLRLIWELSSFASQSLRGLISPHTPFFWSLSLPSLSPCRPQRFLLEPLWYWLWWYWLRFIRLCRSFKVIWCPLMLIYSISLM